MIAAGAKVGWGIEIVVGIVGAALVGFLLTTSDWHAVRRFAGSVAGGLAFNAIVC